MDTGSTLHRTVTLLLLATMIRPFSVPQRPVGDPASQSSIETIQETVPEPVELPAPQPPVDSRVSAAADRFSAAGLEFPDVEVAFHDSKDGCHGHVGLYTGDQVHVCVKEAGLYQQRTLLHELAHAWAGQHLSDEERLAFMDLRGTPSWNDPEVEWKNRGFEHLAEIVAWGLLEVTTTPFKIPQHDCQSLTEAFELATAQPVPRAEACP